jgi:hypothetical protein
MATGFVFCILLHHHHLLAKVLAGGGKSLAFRPECITSAPTVPARPGPATTNTSPRPERRLDNIVGQTRDTRKGPNGRKLDAPGQTDRQTPRMPSAAADRDAANPLPGKYWLSQPTLRCVANRHKTNPIRTPHRKHRAGEGPGVVTHYYPASIQGGTPGDRHPAKVSGHLKRLFFSTTGTKSISSQKPYYITILRIPLQGRQVTP